MAAHMYIVMCRKSGRIHVHNVTCRRSGPTHAHSVTCRIGPTHVHSVTCRRSIHLAQGSELHVAASHFQYISLKWPHTLVHEWPFWSDSEI